MHLFWNSAGITKIVEVWKLTDKPNNNAFYRVISREIGVTIFSMNIEFKEKAVMPKTQKYSWGSEFWDLGLVETSPQVLRLHLRIQDQVWDMMHTKPVKSPSTLNN